MIYISYTTKPPGFLRRILALITTLVLIVLGLVFSAVFFVAILAIVAVFWTYLWWNTRKLRKRVVSYIDLSIYYERKFLEFERLCEVYLAVLLR
ncbi:hypothetical protein CCP3SC15_180005 [Gammaproteobacteria bacterium]